MIQQTPQADQLKEQLRDSLQREALNSHAIKIARHDIRIKTKISHEELSAMVGTTRPRISMFMERFRKHGLLRRTA
jgi:CRP-like cAMP-binding protein